MDNIKQIDTEWASLFHKVVDEILAPRGYEDHHSGKRIAKLEFLTEDRIKKVANSTKRVLYHFKQRLEENITTSMYNLVNDNDHILKKINKEKSMFFIFRDNLKLGELENQHFTNATILKVLPEILKSISTIIPY